MVTSVQLVVTSLFFLLGEAIYLFNLMDAQCFLLCCVLTVMIVGKQPVNTNRTKRRLLDFRKMAKVFVRYNVKVDVVPYTSTFAFAMGFRANWDVKPNGLLHPKRRISYDPALNSVYSQYNPYSNFQYQYNPYQFWAGQYQKWPARSNYQRAIHSAVQGAFDWHGLNGTACLERTFCEVSMIHHDDIISQILKIVFNSTQEIDCPETPDCPWSLVEIVDRILTVFQRISTNE